MKYNKNRLYNYYEVDSLRFDEETDWYNAEISKEEYERLLSEDSAKAAEYAYYRYPVLTSAEYEASIMREALENFKGKYDKDAEPAVIMILH